MAHDPPAPQTPLPAQLSDIIPYNINLLPFSLYWKSVIDVLAHLDSSPQDRKLLLEEVQCRTQNQPRYFLIYHPLFHYDLLLHSRHNDTHFCIIIDSIWMLEQIPPFRTMQNGRIIWTLHKGYHSSSGYVPGLTNRIQLSALTEYKPKTNQTFDRG